jgi:hypothetical protein
MNKQQKTTMNQFFKVAKKLSKLGVIRSSKYLGDIAEFICSNLYEIQLNPSGRAIGFDGTDLNGNKVEVKYHGGESGNNIDLSGYKKNQIFNDLYIILGPDSKIRPDNSPPETYLVYRIENYTYEKYGNMAKTILSEIGFDKVLDIDFNDITEQHILPS